MLKKLVAFLFVVAQLHAQDSTHYEIRELSIKEDNSTFSLHCSYPHIYGLGDSMVQSRCNNRIDSLIDGWVEYFRKYVREADERLGDSNRVESSYQKISYEVGLAKNAIISIHFDEGLFIAGSAHPGSNSRSLTLDLHTGEELWLSDFFDPKSNFLDTISHYCIADLIAQGCVNDFALTDGASPTKENYEKFTLDEQSLIITFDVYQVDSYGDAPGGYEVDIPWAKLKNVLKKNGSIESLLK